MMTIVEMRDRNGSRDQFPVGMRVLAVDDDPTCLKVLETLLLRCQYHVTATNQAIEALKMLRENKDQFDLVISDVHMPDMDGFKLLELVGLEMDLPVIMLSANGETQAVMKGITHGACDYLIKPVRIEELKNIWQHVIRRKKFDPRDQNNLDSWEDCEKAQLAISEGTQGSTGYGSSDRDAKFNRKRKDQNEEDEDDREAHSNENEDPSAQKKPRVVWSVELHRKFVAAVNQLGIDKAVPKRILDLMNVEGLTRENVASHLQKYRLYLKRLSAVANQQASMVAALRSRDPFNLSMGSLDGYGNFNSLVGNRELPCSSSFPSDGTVPRLNHFTGFGLHGFVTSGASQHNRTLNYSSNSTNSVAKLQGIGLQTLQGNQQGALVQGIMPSSFANSTKSPPHLSQANNRQSKSAVLSNSSSVKIPTLSSNSFGIIVGDSSNSVDRSRCAETWQGSSPSTSYSANTISMSLPVSHNGFSSSNFRDKISPVVSRSNICDVSCSSVVMTHFNDPLLANSQTQAASLLSTRDVSGDANLLSFRNFGNSSRNQSLMCKSLSNSSLPNIHTTDQNFSNQALDGGFPVKITNVPVLGQQRHSAPFTTLESEKTAIDGHLHYRDESFSGDMTSQGMLFGSGGFGLDDIVANAIIKQERDDFQFIDTDLGCSDVYSLGACI